MIDRRSFLSLAARAAAVGLVIPDIARGRSMVGWTRHPDPVGEFWDYAGAFAICWSEKISGKWVHRSIPWNGEQVVTIPAPGASAVLDPHFTVTYDNHGDYVQKERILQDVQISVPGMV